MCLRERARAVCEREGEGQREREEREGECVRKKQSVRGQESELALPVLHPGVIFIDGSAHLHEGDVHSVVRTRRGQRSSGGSHRWDHGTGLCVCVHVCVCTCVCVRARVCACAGLHAYIRMWAW